MSTSTSSRPTASSSTASTHGPSRHELRGQRHHLRPGRLRLAGRLLRDPRPQRARHLRDAHRVLRRPRRATRRHRHARRQARLPRSPGHQRDRAHARRRVRGRLLVGLQPRAPVRGRGDLRRARTGSRPSSARPTATASPSSSTSCSTTSARATCRCGSSTGSRQRQGRDLLLPRTGARTPRGATPTRLRPRARSGSTCRDNALHVDRGVPHGRAALRRHALHPHHRRHRHGHP